MKRNLISRTLMAALGIMMVYSTVEHHGTAAHDALVSHGMSGWLVMAVTALVLGLLALDVAFCIVGATAACRVCRKYRQGLWMSLSVCFSVYALVMIKNGANLAEVTTWSIYALTASGMALQDLLNLRHDTYCKMPR